MKKFVAFVALFSVAALGASAGTNPTEVKTYKSQHFNHGLSFSKIVVEDDIDLVIYENASTNIQFDGKKEDIEKVDWKVKNGVLYLKSRTGSLKSKVIATIDVAGLTEIMLHGQSSVRSLGNLNSAKLNVFMRSGCYVSIRNYGPIEIINTDETELNVVEYTGDIRIG